MNIKSDVKSTEWESQFADCCNSVSRCRTHRMAPDLLLACKAALVTMYDDEIYHKCKETILHLEYVISKTEVFPHD